MHFPARRELKPVSVSEYAGEECVKLLQAFGRTFPEMINKIISYRVSSLLKEEPAGLFDDKHHKMNCRAVIFISQFTLAFIYFIA